MPLIMNIIYFDFFSQFSDLLVSFFNFHILANAANYVQPYRDLFYNVMAVNPLPSAIFGLGSDYFNSIDRVTIYAPTPAFYEMLDNGILYSLLVAIICSVPLSFVYLSKQLSLSFLHFYY